MKIILRQKGLEVTPSLRKYIDEKLVAPTKKLFDGAALDDRPALDIEISRTTKHHRKGLVYYAEANVTVGKTVLHVEVTAEDIRAACDMLKDELEATIKKFKGKADAKFRRGARRAKAELRFDRAAALPRGKRVREEGL